MTLNINNILYSPVEQFSIICLLPLRLGNYDISFTNSSLYLLVVTGIFLLYSNLIFKNGGLLIPSRWQLILESIYEFVVNLVDAQIGVKGKPFFPLIFTVFTFILLSNVVGLIPYGFTTTSHLAITFGLSISLFIGITLVGFQIHGLHFLSFFLPKGVPLVLASLLVIIEIVSYLSRPVSLGVRLFANMMAGHILLHVLSGFAYSSFCASGILFLAGLFPLFAVIGVTLLEILVACLQAYVFTVLICIYINDARVLH